jgi:hypothetical protein
MTLASFAMMDEVYQQRPQQQSQSFPVAESMPRVLPPPPPRRRRKRRPAPAPAPAPASTASSTDPATVNMYWLAIIGLLLVVALLLLALVKLVSSNQHLSNLLLAQSYMRPAFLAPR